MSAKKAVVIDDDAEELKPLAKAQTHAFRQDLASDSGLEWSEFVKLVQWMYEWRELCIRIRNSVAIMLIGVVLTAMLTVLSLGFFSWLKIKVGV